MALRSIVAKVVSVTLCSLPVFPLVGDAQALQDPAQILQKSRDAYAALKSYSDTGIVLDEYATSSQDRYTFTTSFNRAPRGFLLDFRNQGGGRYVIWGDPDAFHTWKTGTDQVDFPNPNNLGAITGSQWPTKGASMKIPTLLWGKSNLSAKMLELADPALDGTEDVDKRRCYRITGRASDVYAQTGKEVNVHKVTVWIDAESFLIRKMLEEWKAGPGARTRVTTNFQPSANPALDASRFKFVVPTSR